MFDEDALTFIIGNDFLLVGKGEITHAEMVQQGYYLIRNEKTDYPMMFKGSLESLKKSIESANNKVNSVGVSQGRMWVNSKVIAFWETKKYLKSYQAQIANLFKAINMTPKEFEFQYEKTNKFGKGGVAVGKRHSQNLGTKYITPDAPNLKTPEEERFEKMLRNRNKLKEFYEKNKNKINKLFESVNSTSSSDGYTNELSPFASWDGYVSTIDRKVKINRDYNLNEKLDNIKKYVYGNTGDESARDTFSVISEDMRKILNVYDKINKLYLEYVSSDKLPGEADDGSDYTSRGGQIGKGNSRECGTGTPTLKSQKNKPKNNPDGFGNTPPEKLSDDNKKKYTRTPKNHIISK